MAAERALSQGWGLQQLGCCSSPPSSERNRARAELLEADLRRLNALNQKLRSQLQKERERKPLQASSNAKQAQPDTALSKGAEREGDASRKRPGQGVRAELLEAELRRANQQVQKLSEQLRIMDAREARRDAISRATSKVASDPAEDLEQTKVGSFKRFGKRLKAELERETERRIHLEGQLCEAEAQLSAAKAAAAARSEAHARSNEKIHAAALEDAQRRAVEANLNMNKEVSELRAQLRDAIGAKMEAEAQRDAITRLSLTRRTSPSDDERWQALATRAQASILQLQRQLLSEKQMRVALELERGAQAQFTLPATAMQPVISVSPTSAGACKSPQPPLSPGSSAEPWQPLASAMHMQQMLRHLEARVAVEAERRAVAEHERDRALGMLAATPNRTRIGTEFRTPQGYL